MKAGKKLRQDLTGRLALGALGLPEKHIASRADLRGIRAVLVK